MGEVIPGRRVTISVQEPDLEFVVDAAIAAMRVEVALIEAEEDADCAPGPMVRHVAVSVEPTPELLALMESGRAFLGVRR